MHASVLSCFIEVARCGSIRKAARNLFVASSAVNRQILNLEKELNTKLFVRLPTGIRLTGAGSFSQHHEGLPGNADGVRRAERRAHRAYYCGRAGLTVLQPAAGNGVGVCATVPCGHLFHGCRRATKVTDKVSSGDCDIGITFFNKSLVGLKAIAKVNFPAGVVMDSAHPLTKKTTVTPEDCRGYSVLRVGGLTSTDDIVSSDMARAFSQLV